MNVELMTKAAERIETLAGQTQKATAELDARLGQVEQMVVEAAKGAKGLTSARANQTFGELITKDIGANDGIRRITKGDRTSVLLEPDRPLSVKALVSQGNSTSSDDPHQDFAYSRESATMGRFVHPQPRLLSFLPTRPVDAPTHVYVRTAAVGDAEEQAIEGDEKASIELATQAVTAHICTVAAHTSMSVQLVQDIGEVRQLVDTVLRSKVLSRLEHLLINGTGGQGSIDGLVNQSELFTPIDATTDADIIGEAVVAQEEVGYQPNLIVMAASDWHRIRIAKESGSGAYIFGSPSEVRAPSLWGRAVVTSSAMPAGQALILDTSFLALLDRMAPTVMVSTQHADNFTRNLATVLCEVRAGLQVGETGAVMRVVLSSAASSSSSE